MSKHMLMLKDASLYEIIAFLDSADQHGHAIPTQIGPEVRDRQPNAVLKSDVYFPMS